ncbi:MAG: hypothetical protein QOE35_3074 [Actinomycetota bacterium]
MSDEGVEPDDEQDDDEVVFELADWTDEDRAAVRDRLQAKGIAHEWEDGDLVVADADADAADDAIEAVEFPDELPADADDTGDGADDADADDGGVGYALMSALFVAADRLQHDPEDPRVGGAFDEAADAVVAAAPPYGVAAEQWKQLQELAANVCDQLDEADADVIARDAGALRQLLSRYV